MARLLNLTLALTTLVASTASTPSTAQGQSVYTSGDTSGCGKTHLLPGVTAPRTVTSSGTMRTYSIHIPSSYDASHQYPLIVGYHGSSSIGLFLEADTRLDEAQYTGDKIVVYPDGVGGAWAGANYSSTTVPQDLQFTWDLLADVRRNYCVDSARIYATGLSNGGGFVGTLACNDTVGGEFAAFAPAAGAFYTDNHGPDDGCTPARSLTPIMEFHGGADADVFYSGGPGVRRSWPVSCESHGLISFAGRRHTPRDPGLAELVGAAQRVRCEVRTRRHLRR